MSDATVRAAIAELRSIRSSDPCAAVALSTVRTTILTLETRWLVGPSAGVAPSAPGSPTRHR